MTFLAVGLGNPGLRYKNSRHNIGFMAAEKLAEKIGIEFSKNDFGGIYGSGVLEEKKLIVFKPQNYMNTSGEPVRKIMRFYGIETGSLAVLHDEADLPAGRIQVKLGGSAAGHNGIKSLIEQIGDGFLRVRIGIGRPMPGADTAGYVLSDFAKSEKQEVQRCVEKAADAVCETVLFGAQQAMNKFNFLRNR